MTTETAHSLALSETPPQTSNMRRFLRVFLARKLVIAGIIVLLLLVIIAIFAPLIAPYDPYEQNLSKSFLSPSMEHLLGTDLLGRDVLSRIIYGSRTSLLVGIGVISIGGFIGIAIGLLCGYFGGILDTVFMRVMDAIMAFPTIILALTLGAALGGGLTNIIIALGIAVIPNYARLMRGQVLAVRQADYVVASEIIGARNLRNILVHVLPNCMAPIIVLITWNLGIAILAEAGLSFLGLGIDPPGAAWGAMVSDGYQYLENNPTLSFAPGFAVILVVLAFNIVGDALRDALDPRLRGIK